MGNDKMQKPYTIGVDIGTNSVGWAAIYDDFSLVQKELNVKYKKLDFVTGKRVNSKKKKVLKNFWGVSLFDAGEGAQKRRITRTARRRLARRRYRLVLLQQIFEKDILEADPSFFHRLEDSFLQQEEKRKETKSTYPLFITKEKEKKFYKDFPTIYHLRKALADNEAILNDWKTADGRIDLRLIYLALHHIFKYRGHFIQEGVSFDISNISIAKNLDDMLEKFENLVDRSFDISNKESGINEIFADKRKSKSSKVEGLMDLCKVGDKDIDKQLKALFTAIVGNKINCVAIFDNKEQYDEKVTEIKDVYYSKDSFDDDLDKLAQVLSEEELAVLESGKSVYSSIILSKVLSVSSSNAKLSAGMVEKYEQHKNDLALLKAFIKMHMLESYNEIFKRQDKDKDKDKEKKAKTVNHNYADYIDGGTKTTAEEFYKFIKTYLEPYKESPETPFASEAIAKIENGDFLPKQRTFLNGAIPYQVHLSELLVIIENFKSQYPFLGEPLPSRAEKDNKQNNITKLEKLLTFRIPYYVGPLIEAKMGEAGKKASDKSDFAWMQKNDGFSNVKITPLNFDEVVDKDRSATEFIERMTSYCTYLPTEKVLPKASLIYQEFCALNELVNVGYFDKSGKVYFDSKDRQELFERLFKTKKIVRAKDVQDFIYSSLSGPDRALLFGIDKNKGKQKFNSSLSTYHDMVAIFGKPRLDALLKSSFNLLEEITKFQTVFTDQKQTKRAIANENKRYGTVLTEEEVEKLSKKHYSGFGNLSQKLLAGIRDKDKNQTIIEWLKYSDYGYNLMRLVGEINDPKNENVAPFKDIILTARNQYLGIEEQVLSYENVSNLAGSPALKKGIWQTIKIILEIEQIMGYAPARITLEFAREDQNTSRTKSRYKQLDALYKVLGQEYLETKNELQGYEKNEAALSNERLFLYMTQNGKCMYTGEALNISDLSAYHVDHIVPQCYIKDDSLDNKALVTNQANTLKGGSLPGERFKKQEGFWGKLKDAKLISERKYKALTRNEKDFDKSKEGFINRQLVETRQIMKHVATMLNEYYKKEETEIITLKASLASEFRSGSIATMDSKQDDANKVNPVKIHDGYPKIREINEYHHAHDAYLNAVVANFLYFYGNYENVNMEGIEDFRKLFIYGQYKRKVQKNIGKGASSRKNAFMNLLTEMAEPQWLHKETGAFEDAKEHLATIEKVMNYRQVNVVKKPEKQDGQFSDETIWPKPKKGNKIKGTELPAKKNLPFEKYGGRNDIKSAYAVLVRQGKKVKLLNIPIINSKEFEADPESFFSTNTKVLLKQPLLKYQSFRLKDCCKRMLASYQEAHKSGSFSLCFEEYRLINCIIKSKDEKIITEYSDNIDSLLTAFIDYIVKDKLLGDTAQKNLQGVIDEFEVTKDITRLQSLIQVLIDIVSFGTGSNNKVTGRSRYPGGSGNFTNATLVYYSTTGLLETRLSLKNK